MWEKCAFKIAVDKNRNGFVSLGNDDKTSESDPFRFWINNDRDFDGFGFDSETDTSLIDSDLDIIRNIRDLEDFAKMRITLCSNMKQLVDQGYRLAIHTTGELNIKAFRASSPGLDYLQKVNTKSRGNPLDLNKLSSELQIEEFLTGSVNLLFEGVKKGKGVVQLVLLAPDGTSEVQSEFYLELYDVKEMYARVIAEPFTLESPGVVDPFSFEEPIQPDIRFRLDSKFPLREEIPKDNSQVIIFIHGWNMTDGDRFSFSETMFKRLWWAGYNGKFVSFFWPTTELSRR